MTTISKKICTSCAVAAVLIAGAFFLLPKGAHNSEALASPAKPVQQAQVNPEPDVWKIVPADPLSPDGVSSWAPLTGDGSN
jgi:hypothetical protein